MTRYRLTPAAQRDLSSIWDYTAERWDVREAEIYVNEIRPALERVAEDPHRGRSCDEIREGYRNYAVRSHLLFYRASSAGDGIELIRILHQRMDPTRHL